MKQLAFIVFEQWPESYFYGEGHTFKADSQKVKMILQYTDSIKSERAIIFLSTGPDKIWMDRWMDGKDDRDNNNTPSTKIWLRGTI